MGENKDMPTFPLFSCGQLLPKYTSTMLHTFVHSRLIAIYALSLYTFMFHELNRTCSIFRAAIVEINQISCGKVYLRKPERIQKLIPVSSLLGLEEKKITP